MEPPPHVHSLDDTEPALSFIFLHRLAALLTSFHLTALAQNKLSFPWVHADRSLLFISASVGI